MPLHVLLAASGAASLIMGKPLRVSIDQDDIPSVVIEPKVIHTKPGAT